METNYELHKLKNGMKILLIPNKETYSATIYAMVNSGAALETKDTQGITHFIEHLSLKTTTKWPSNEKFIEAAELNGAFFNGGTSAEQLNYYINIPYTKVAFGIDFIHQVLYENVFTDNLIEKERKVILDEISKYDNNVETLNYLFSAKKLSKKQSGYTRSVLGSKKTVGSFTKSKLKKANDFIHDPVKVLLVAVGNFSKTKVLAQAKKLFEPITSKCKPEELPFDEIRTSRIETKKDEKTKNIITSIAFPGEADISLSSKEELVLDITLKILSGPRSSRLFRKLRTEEGLLYSIDVYNRIFNKFGVIIISYDISPTNFRKAFHVTLNELAKFKKGVTKKELDHIKEYVINRNLIAYDNVHSYSSLIRSPVFYKKDVLTLEEINKIIKAIAVKDIQEVVDKYFDLNAMSCVAYGNIQTTTKNIMKKEISKIRNA